MKKLTKAEIRRRVPRGAAPKGQIWVGQIGDNFADDQTDGHTTATKAAIEIALYYNDDLRHQGEEVRVARISEEDGYCHEVVILVEAG